MNTKRLIHRLNSIRKKALKGMLSFNRYFITASLLVLVLGSMGTIQTQAAVSYVADLTRYPYLTDVFSPGPGYATINFATLEYAGAIASAKYGLVASNGTCVADQTVAANPATRIRIQNLDGVTFTNESQWSVNLNLQPDTQYCYRVFLNKGAGDVDLLGTDASPKFRTLPRAGANAPLKFIIFGDWGEVDAVTGANPHQQALIQLMSQQAAQFALTTGDNTYNTPGLIPGVPDQSIYGDLYRAGPGRSAVFGPNFWTVAGSSLPIFPSVGNHIISAVDGNLNHPDLLNFPQKNAVSSSGGVSTVVSYPPTIYGTNPINYPSLYYAFSAGMARFYVLTATWGDSNVGTGTLYDNDYVTHWTPTSPEYMWLENDLKTHPDPIKFVIYHFPMYSDGPEGSDTRLQGPASLEGLLTKYGAQFGFSGHSHIYERNQAVNGLTNYVTGGGGSDLVPVGPCNSYDLYAIGWSQTSGGKACGAASIPTAIGQVFHFLLITVNGTQVTITPINELGQKFDEQVYNLTVTLPPL